MPTRGVAPGIVNSGAVARGYAAADAGAPGVPDAPDAMME